MSRILVAYSTNSGSTGEVAQAIADELTLAGHSAEARAIAKVTDLNGFDTVVIGAPMIFGWHAEARRFLRRHRKELAGKKAALFACAMRLTVVPGMALPEVPVALDPTLVSEPQTVGKLIFKERFTEAGHYLEPMLKAASGVKPVQIAFFKGNLDMRKLKWWQAAFVMLVVQATPGNYRDWEYMRSWARDISKLY
jgi:menaquinone-dependent protoporphyrinogen IX oxidase